MFTYLIVYMFVYLFRSNVKNLQDKTKEVKVVVKDNLNKALDRDQALGDIEQRAGDTFTPLYTYEPKYYLLCPL